MIIFGCFCAYSSLTESFRLMFGVMKLMVSKGTGGTGGLTHTTRTHGREGGERVTMFAEYF